MAEVATAAAGQTVHLAKKNKFKGLLYWLYVIPTHSRFKIKNPWIIWYISKLFAEKEVAWDFILWSVWSIDIQQTDLDLWIVYKNFVEFGFRPAETFKSEAHHWANIHNLINLLREYQVLLLGHVALVHPFLLVQYVYWFFFIKKKCDGETGPSHVLNNNY
jgi:hypothetical protein